jgi:hypothetical protein
MPPPHGPQREIPGVGDDAEFPEDVTGLDAFTKPCIGFTPCDRLAKLIRMGAVGNVVLVAAIHEEREGGAGTPIRAKRVSLSPDVGPVQCLKP